MQYTETLKPEVAARSGVTVCFEIVGPGVVPGIVRFTLLASAKDITGECLYQVYTVLRQSDQCGFTPTAQQWWE